jgi:hypothetical protein
MSKDYTPLIGKKELKHGAYYEGFCRNASIARWDSKKEVYIHWRSKFGTTFLEEIRCPEDDKNWDVFIATKEIPTPTKEIPITEVNENDSH